MDPDSGSALCFMFLDMGSVQFIKDLIPDEKI
jgi:hypothetical protein